MCTFLSECNHCAVQIDPFPLWLCNGSGRESIMCKLQSTPITLLPLRNSWWNRKETEEWEKTGPQENFNVDLDFASRSHNAIDIHTVPPKRVPKSNDPSIDAFRLRAESCVFLDFFLHCIFMVAPQHKATISMAIMIDSSQVKCVGPNTCCSVLEKTAVATIMRIG